MKKIVILLLSFAILSSCDKRELRELKDPFTGQLVEQFQIIETKEGSFLKDGFYKRWYNNGQIEIFGNYAKNKKTGKWIEYFPNGQTSKTYEFTDDQLNGAYFEFYENGIKKTEGNYISNKSSGTWKSWYENSQIAKIENYENNFLNGTIENFHSNGQKESQISYFKGVKEGPAVFWHQNGQKKSEGNYSNDKKTGNEWIYWDENGVILLNKVEFIIGKWHNGNSTREFKVDGSLTVTWDKGGKIEYLNYVVKDNKLIFYNIFGMKEYPFLSFEQNSFSIKENNGVIWNYKRLN